MPVASNSRNPSSNRERLSHGWQTEDLGLDRRRRCRDVRPGPRRDGGGGSVVREDAHRRPDGVGSHGVTDFEEVRRQFTNQKPLIELDERGHFVHANTDRPTSDRRPQSLNVMAFDPDEGRVVKMDIPFWLLATEDARQPRRHRRTIRSTSATLKLTVEDLERYGPDAHRRPQGRAGERVLVWSQ